MITSSRKKGLVILMRIDASQVLGQGGVKIKMGTGAATDSLKEGDVIRAGVVSNDKNGAVTLKMENGQSFSAKLGTDIKLSPGDTILLEVTGKDKGQVSLSFVGVENADDDLSLGQKNLVADFSDKSLAPFANKLAQLNMPVTEESARMMRDLIAQNPKLSLDEAAFLASNKLTGDENLMKAALSIIANGDKTDAMIARLMALVNEQTSLTDLNLGLRNPDLAAEGSKLTNILSSVEGSPAFTVSTANTAPLTELLTTLVKNFSNAQTIISQPNINMQTNAENAQENLQPPVQSPGQGDGSSVLQSPGSVLSGGIPAIIQGDGSPVSGTSLTQGDGSSIPGSGSEPSGESIRASGGAVPETAAENQTPQTTTATQTATPAAQQPQQTTQPASLTGVVAQVLSNIPEFSGTPQSALHRFSEMLLRVAGENPGAADNTESLTAQLDKLFTKISKDDTDAGARLRGAREELYTRLALIEEAISRAAQPARAEMLVQTQRLMDHVRLLNSIEQFVYMQLPVQLSEEKKTADLYVFKRKGGKRADPENVNILLAIDLEFMGHWEALLNIKNKEVSIQMEVQGEAEKDHFNANTVMLHNMLTDAGFKLVSTNIKFSEEETTPLTALSAFDRYTGGKQGIIDFRI